MAKIEYHSAHFKIEPNRIILWEVLSAYLSKYINSEAKVLEIGAGYCYWINSIKAKRKDAVDIWEDMSKYANEDINTHIKDLSKGLPNFDTKFNNILASNLFEHIDSNSIVILLEDIFKNLEIGGRLILIQPNFKYAYKNYFDDYTHKTIYTNISLANLLKSIGFEIEIVKPKFTPYSMIGMNFTIPSFLIKLYLFSPFKPYAGQMLIIARKM